MLTSRFDDIMEQTPLHEAALEDNLALATRLLNDGADVNARDWYDNTPLMDACTVTKADLRKIADIMAQVEAAPKAAFDLNNLPRFDPKAMFARVEEERSKREHDDAPSEDDPALPRLLLERGASVNAVDKEGRSALMKAASAGRVETMRVLLEYGADLRATDKEDQTVLMLAARSRRLGAVQFLLMQGADADYRTPGGGTTLMAAALGGRVEIAKLLLEYGQDVNTVSVNGNTALLWAAISGQDEMAAFLREMGANVGFLEAVALDIIPLAESLPVPDQETRGPQWGQAVLNRAIKTGRAEAVRLMLQRGVDPNVEMKHGTSLLMGAVMRDDVETARLLLDAGANPNGAADSHFLPLGYAAQHGYMEMVNLLLERGANPNAPGKDGMRTLSGAVMYGNTEAARKLLEAGADPNQQVHGTMSLLTYAAIKGDTAMVALLLEYGANPDAREQGGSMAKAMARDKPEIKALFKEAQGVTLHELAKEGKTDELLARLDAGDDMEARGEHGFTLLLSALRGKQSETARALIERGANINAIDDLGQTALYLAAVQNNVTLTRLLLERGADVKPADINGQTALLATAIWGKPDTIPLLIEYGASLGPVEAAVLGDLPLLRQLLNDGAGVDTRSPGGMTPLMGAAVGGHLEAITALLTRGADINATDDEGKTALTWAVARQRIEAVNLLLDNGADVNLSGENLRWNRHMEKRQGKLSPDVIAHMEKIRPKRGPSPLGYAALHESTILAELLLQRGADINAPGSLGNDTPLHSAALMGKLETVRFLLERGADPTIKDHSGFTPLRKAEFSGKSPEIVELLKAHTAAKARSDSNETGDESE